MMDRLAGKMALVIGASSEIARSICRTFVAEGARVIIGDHGHAKDKVRALEELSEFGPDAFALEIDVRLEEHVRAAIEEGR